MAFVLRFSSKVVVFFAVLLIIVSNMELQGVMGFKEKLVGGHHGWHLPDANETDFYNVWASKTRFHVGDSLRFQYQNDSVLVVDKFGYYHCDTTKATSTYNDGNTLIKLEQPGFMYFISGSPDNCHNGQRLVVDVMSPHPSPTAVPPASSTGQAVSPGPAQHDNSGSMVHVSALLFVGLVAGSAFLL